MKKPMPLPKPVKPGSGNMKKPMPMPKKDVPEYSKAIPVNGEKNAKADLVSARYTKEQLQGMAKEAYKKITKKG
jgi:hypothetical protein